MSKKVNKPEPVAEVFEPEVVEIILDEPEILEIEAPAMPKVHVCVHGDSYPGIAARYTLPLGMTRHQYAKHLLTINKGKTLSAGVEVIL